MQKLGVANVAMSTSCLREEDGENLFLSGGVDPKRPIGFWEETQDFHVGFEGR